MIEQAVIVGAGIAGLATANGLSQAGVDVTVLERNDTLSPPGLGLALQPNGLQALDLLGLGDGLRSRAFGYTTARSELSDGSLLFELPFPRDELGRPTAHGVHRNDLLDALTETLDARVMLGTTIEAIEQTGDAVRATLDDGTEVVADVVIGADGIDSVVRRRLPDEGQVVDRSYVAWRGLVPRGDGDPPEPRIRAGDEAIFGSFPVRDDALYLFALRHVTGDEQLDPGRAGLMAVATGFEPSCGDMAEQVADDELIFVPVREVELERWVDGRIALVGDAAHAVVPYLAQGAAQALEDAATVVTALVSDHEPTVGLNRWFAERRGRVELVRDVCRIQGIAATLEGRDAAAALDPARREWARSNAARLYDFPDPLA